MSVLNSKDIEYKSYVLSDIGVIELLIAYRYKYDDYYDMRQDSSLLAVNGVVPVNEEMILTYVDLDEYIRKCEFNELQLKMIKMIEQGFTHDEIAEANGIRHSVVSGRLKTIYRRIAKENERQWRKSTYLNRLDLKSKKCSKCSEELPATSEFYRDHSVTKDGFQSQCRSCEK